MRLVSITSAGEMTRLRRYEIRSGQRVCTHAGAYRGGVTPNNLLNYHDFGAAQDRLEQAAHRRARPARAGAPPAA